MEFLINDLLFEIFAYCRYLDLAYLKQTNKRFQKLITERYQSCPYKFKVRQYSVRIDQSGIDMEIFHDVTSLNYSYLKFCKFISDFNSGVKNIEFEFSDGFSGKDFKSSLSIDENKLTIWHLGHYDSYLTVKNNEIEILKFLKIIFDSMRKYEYFISDLIDCDIIEKDLSELDNPFD